MPVFEFQLTCLDKNSCKMNQLTMSDFKNRNVKSDNVYDHTAVKKFPDWEDAINASKDITLRLGDHLIDLMIVQR